MLAHQLCAGRDVCQIVTSDPRSCRNSSKGSELRTQSLLLANVHVVALSATKDQMHTLWMAVSSNRCIAVRPGQLARATLGAEQAAALTAISSATLSGGASPAQPPIWTFLNPRRPDSSQLRQASLAFAETTKLFCEQIWRN